MNNKKTLNMQQEEHFINNCRYLGLKLLSENYQFVIDKAIENTPGYHDFIKDIVQAEAESKHQRHIGYLTKNSRLPQPYKLISDFDFGFQPTLNPKLIKDLATLSFVEKNESILFIGSTGTGKSHLAQSIAFNACQKGYKTLYTTCSELITDLNAGVYEKTLDQRIRRYISADLLVIDEMGHDRLELQVIKEAHLLFKVIDKRYNENKSLIFTTNVEESDWPEFLGDPVSTSAILDRIFHHSVVVTINGPSYRKHQGKLLQEKYLNKKNKKEEEPDE